MLLPLPKSTRLMTPCIRPCFTDVWMYLNKSRKGTTMRLQLDTLSDMDVLIASDLIYAWQKVSWSFLAIFTLFPTKKKNGLWTDRRTDRRTDRQTDRRTDGPT